MDLVGQEALPDELVGGAKWNGQQDLDRLWEQGTRRRTLGASWAETSGTIVMVASPPLMGSGTIEKDDPIMMSRYSWAQEHRDMK